MNNFKTIRDITEADADEFVIDIDDDEEELMAKAWHPSGQMAKQLFSQYNVLKLE